MYFGFTLQELLLIAAITPLLLATIIALLNFDWLNNGIMNFHQWIVRKHSTTTSGVFKFFLSLFKYPGQLPHGVSHSGWKSGLTLFTSTFSTVILGGVLAGIGILTYYVIMITLVIIAVIVILVIIGAILGGGS